MGRQRLDRHPLAAAYERDGRRLLVFLTRRTYDAQLAVDLVAEIYARALERG
jgi:DNA-directed RNA polymerase specialized sigma24 family protein